MLSTSQKSQEFGYLIEILWGKFKEVNASAGLHLVVFGDEESPNMCLLLR